MALLFCAGARMMQGVKDTLFAFTIKFECLEGYKG